LSLIKRVILKIKHVWWWRVGWIRFWSYFVSIKVIVKVEIGAWIKILDGAYLWVSCFKRVVWRRRILIQIDRSMVLIKLKLIVIVGWEVIRFIRVVTVGSAVSIVKLMDFVIGWNIWLNLLVLSIFFLVVVVALIVVKDVLGSWYWERFFPIGWLERCFNRHLVFPFCNFGGRQIVPINILLKFFLLNSIEKLGRRNWLWIIPINCLSIFWLMIEQYEKFLSKLLIFYLVKFWPYGIIVNPLEKSLKYTVHIFHEENLQ